jgi:hypothetical protein
MWAFVFKGISKKGLPGWKMFRVDRIKSAKLNFDVSNFKLKDLPGYQKNKAPSAMKSLSSVEIFSRVTVPITLSSKSRSKSQDANGVQIAVSMGTHRFLFLVIFIFCINAVFTYLNFKTYFNGLFLALFRLFS